jgi:Flp pilus assembly pilin Flp
MKALLLRLWKDESGSTGILGQALLISGVSLTVIPATQKVGTQLVAVFTKISNALH